MCSRVKVTRWPILKLLDLRSMNTKYEQCILYWSEGSLWIDIQRNRQMGRQTKRQSDLKTICPNYLNLWHKKSFSETYLQHKMMIPIRPMMTIIATATEIPTISATGKKINYIWNYYKEHKHTRMWSLDICF